MVAVVEPEVPVVSIVIGMNYFAHGYRHLDRPWFLAGTAIPDWLNVVDRRIRVRARTVASFLDGSHRGNSVEFQELAAGVTQHHHDDGWFHRTRAFAELSLQFAVLLRDSLPVDDGLRPGFLGHILVELLLDDILAAEKPELLADYYDALAGVDPVAVERFVSAATGKPAAGLAKLIPRFIEVRFLYDYADNAKLLFRLNQVMRRVGLAQIPAQFADLLPQMRTAVRERKDQLLTPCQPTTEQA